MFFEGRVKRLKQAKDEAVSEIEAYKAEQEKKHKHLETTVLNKKIDSLSYVTLVLNYFLIL